MLRKITSWGLMLVFGGVIFASCSKDAPPTPDLPPVEAFDIAFDDFSDSDGKMLADTLDSTRVNHTHAIIHATVWNLILGVNLGIPMASFKEAMNHDPEWMEDEEYFSWKYNVTHAGGTYSADLQAKIDGDYIDWSMYLSKSGGFQDFLWYTGRSANDRKSGTWSLNRNPNNATAYIDIEWNSDLNGTSDVKFTHVTPGVPGNGDFINFGRNTDADFDRFYTIHDESDGNLIEIKWLLSTKDGRLKNPRHFGNSDWHCWVGDRDGDGIGQNDTDGDLTDNFQDRDCQ